MTPTNLGSACLPPTTSSDVLFSPSTCVTARPMVWTEEGRFGIERATSLGRVIRRVGTRASAGNAGSPTPDWKESWLSWRLGYVTNLLCRQIPQLQHLDHRGSRDPRPGELGNTAHGTWCIQPDPPTSQHFRLERCADRHTSHALLMCMQSCPNAR